MLEVRGRAIEPLDPAEFEAWQSRFATLHVDLGTGDGRYAYELARRAPSRAVLGIDADREALAEYSRRASRKPARGGLPNVRYLAASIESLPPELAGRASGLSIILPWGSLLSACARPELALLAGLRALCAPRSSLELLLTYHDVLDPGEVARLDLPPLDAGLLDRLRPGYYEAGFVLESAELVTESELAAIPSTWAKRLAHGGRERDAWRLRGRAI